MKKRTERNAASYEYSETNNNKRRIKDITKILKTYQHETEGEFAVSDLIADLMHFCDHEGYDFTQCLERGEKYYSAEVWEAEYEKQDND